MTQYLLPCECGRKLPVSVSQAGDRIACECGAVVEAPTLRRLKQLEPAGAAVSASAPSTTAAPVAKRRSWTPSQGVAFLGLALVAISGLGAVVLLAVKPQKPVDVVQPLDVASMSPATAWTKWAEIKLGLDRQMTISEAEPLHYLVIWRDIWGRLRQGAIWGVVIGATLAAGGFLMTVVNANRPKAKALVSVPRNSPPG